jgi:hypothetical protein
MATVSTNLAKPKKKKKSATADVGTVRPFKVEQVGKHELTFERGKTTKSYEAKRVHTGHPAYGKEDPSKKDAAFIEEARKKKQEIAYDKEGKPYRAGVTTETKTPDKIGITKTKIRIVPAVKSVKPTMSAEEIRQKGGDQPKRKLIRVDYLRNKDAKGGISQERGRKKSKSGY